MTHFMHPLDSGGTLLVNETLRPWFPAGKSPESPLIEWAAHEFGDPTKDFVDIGAHVGSWTITLGKHFRHVHAFEPQRDPFYCLCGGVALSGLSQKVTARQLALGEAGGPWQRSLVAATADGGTGTIINAVNLGMASPEHREIVNGARLDDFDFMPIGLVKIDVEGAELDVWKGAQQTLIKHGRPPVFFECWQDERGQRRDQLFAWVKAFGYNINLIAHYPEMYLATRA